MCVAMHKQRTIATTQNTQFTLTPVVQLKRNVNIVMACECIGQFCFLVEFGILSRISSCIQGDPVHAGLYLQPWPRCTLRLCHFMLSDSFPWRQKPTLPIVTAKTKLSAGSQTAITPISGGRVKGYLLWTGFAAYGESTLCRMLTLNKQSNPNQRQISKRVRRYSGLDLQQGGKYTLLEAEKSAAVLLPLQQLHLFTQIWSIVLTISLEGLWYRKPRKNAYSSC